MPEKKRIMNVSQVIHIARGDVRGGGIRGSYSFDSFRQGKRVPATIRSGRISMFHQLHPRLIRSGRPPQADEEAGGREAMPPPCLRFLRCPPETDSPRTTPHIFVYQHDQYSSTFVLYMPKLMSHFGVLGGNIWGGGVGNSLPGPLLAKERV